MDKALDDIISKRRPRRNNPRRGAAKAAIIGKKTTPVAPVAARKAVPVGVPTEKIIVSNLPPDVNEAQVKELFTSTIGPLKEVTLNYDQHGKSKGIATVTFARKGDGSKAHTQYNNRLIDGKRPMKIEMVLGPAPPPTLAQRVAPAPAATAVQAAARNAQKTRRAPRPRAPKRPKKTAEDLDAEMEDYTKAETAAAAT